MVLAAWYMERQEKKRRRERAEVQVKMGSVEPAEEKRRRRMRNSPNRHLR